MITKSTISFSILFSVFLLSSRNGIAQEKTKLYLLVDTLSVSKNNQIVEIGKESRTTYYEFHCNGLPPYIYPGPLPITFSYVLEKGVTVEPRSKKPSYNYLSWKEFTTIVSKVKYAFREKYEMYITEALPGNKYITNEVRLVVTNIQYSKPYFSTFTRVKKTLT